MSSLDLPPGYYYISAFFFGLLIGSFLNVVIYRLPRGESIIFPGSHCIACGVSIRTFDNLPLISYALLGGRCRTCRVRISPLYPAVEMLTGVLFAAIVFKSGPGWEALFEMAFAAVMLVLIFIDARYHLLPNVITYPSFIFAFAAATIRSGWGEQSTSLADLSLSMPGFYYEINISEAALIGGLLLALAAFGFRFLDYLDLILFNKYFEWEEKSEEPADSGHKVIRVTMILGILISVFWVITVFRYSPNEQQAFSDAYSGLLGASIGALFGGGLTWCLRALYFYIRGFEGMGLGDVKMLSIIGAFLGWQGAFFVLLLAAILGVAVGVFLAIRSKRGLKTALPFGVCLGIASLIVLLK
ncbi:MAG: prepilin peptidase [Acidobacteria bacterium]|nr:prepilin peptidase [Acidobacteriota bacterium]